jgi:Putative Flp pilus-assembly TadE/G-like
MLFTVLALGVFLVGAIAFAVDLSNIWFSRQSAQTAADAACTAGAMDMLVGATNGSLPAGAGFTPGTAFDCNANPGYSPCSYAALNGFSSSINQSSATSGTLGNNVYVDFPSSVPGVNNGAPSSVTPNAFIRVAVTNNVPTFFAGMLKGLRKQSVSATSICGVVEASSPIPILVLNPTVSGSLHMNGGGSSSNTTGDIQIIGGPAKSIQVNSSSNSAAAFNGGPTINLCGGGSNYCGSSMGVWGTESSPGTNFWSTTTQCASPHNIYCSGTQTSPQWNSPSAPIADPLATTPAPSKPTHHTWTGPYLQPPGGTNGCPLPSTQHCDEYAPGYYPNGIRIQGSTAIFDPGLYWMESRQCNNSGSAGSLCELSNSCIRPSTLPGDGSGGTIFYFADTNSVGVGANGGNCNGVTPFNTATGGSGLGVKCTSSSQIPGNIPGTLTGSVLLAPCNAPVASTGLCAPNCALNYGDPLGTNDPVGEQRGILFFQSRAVNATNNPSWSGGGSMLLAGTMYFHQCVTSGSDTGLGCVSGAYNDQLGLGGTTGSSTYVLGDIIVDQLSVGGSGQVVMDLNPSAAYTTLKAALVQ